MENFPNNFPEEANAEEETIKQSFKKQQQEKEPLKKTIETNPDKITPENLEGIIFEIFPDKIIPKNREDIIEEKIAPVSQKQKETTKEKQTPSTQQPEQLDFKPKILEIIHNADVVLHQKELDDSDKAELLTGYTKKMADLTNVPSEKINLTELITDRNKLNEFINSISQIKEKEPPLPKAVEQAQKFIKEEEEGKDSIFQKIGGWKTIGSLTGFSLFMLIVLIFIGEFKLLEKATGFDFESGGGKKK